MQLKERVLKLQQKFIQITDLIKNIKLEIEENLKEDHKEEFQFIEKKRTQE